MSPCQVLEYHFYLWAQWHRNSFGSHCFHFTKKKKYFLWKSSQPNNYPPLKKNQMKIPWKKQIKTTRVSSAFRRKKINGARKEIFLNEKKKQLCMMLNYNCSKKHTWWNDIYSLQFLQQQKKNNFTKFLKEIYICFFIIIILFSFFNYFFSLFLSLPFNNKVCESLLRYTCMNVVCKIEHIKKPWSLLQKKVPQIPPSNFFFVLT